MHENGVPRLRFFVFFSLYFFGVSFNWILSRGKCKVKEFLVFLVKSMSLSRILFSSSKCRAGDASCLLRRFGQIRKTQSCNYSKSSRYGREESLASRMTTTEAESSKSWPSYVIPSLIVGGFAGFAIFLRQNDERRATPKGQVSGSQANTRLGPVIGGPFTLVNTEKQVVTEKNFLGNWVLLHFGYTSSPDVGPEQLKIMAKAIDILESKQKVKILPVFVTIDPQRDASCHLQAYLKEFDHRIVGLTGPVTAIRQMAQEYRVFFKKVEEEGDDYLIESSHNMYLLNPNMEVVRCFGMEYGADELSEAILKELKRNSS